VKQNIKILWLRIKAIKLKRYNSLNQVGFLQEKGVSGVFLAKFGHSTDRFFDGGKNAFF
jgi:hypothetical protein